MKSEIKKVDPRIFKSIVSDLIKSYTKQELTKQEKIAMECMAGMLYLSFNICEK